MAEYVAYKPEHSDESMKSLLTLSVPIEGDFRARNLGNHRNEGALSPSIEPVPVGGRLSQFVEGWKRITNDFYGVPTSFYEFTFYASPHGRYDPTGAQGGTGNARANIPDATKESNNIGGTEHFRFLIQRVPGTQSVRRMASCDRFETTEWSPQGISFAYVH